MSGQKHGNIMFPEALASFRVTRDQHGKALSGKAQSTTSTDLLAFFALLVELEKAFPVSEQLIQETAFLAVVVS